SGCTMGAGGGRGFGGWAWGGGGLEGIGVMSRGRWLRRSPQISPGRGVGRALANGYYGSDVVVMRAHVCPKCQSKHVSRASPEDVFERAKLKLRRKSVYRCLECDQ